MGKSACPGLSAIFRVFPNPVSFTDPKTDLIQALISNGHNLSFLWQFFFSVLPQTTVLSLFRSLQFSEVFKKDENLAHCLVQTTSVLLEGLDKLSITLADVLNCSFLATFLGPYIPHASQATVASFMLTKPLWPLRSHLCTIPSCLCSCSL